MPSLSIRQISELIDRSSLAFKRVEGTDHDAYTLVWPTQTSEFTIDLLLDGDEDDDEDTFMAVEVTNALTIPIDHPEAVIIYHELLARTGFNSDMKLSFDSGSGRVSLFIIRETPEEAITDSENLDRFESVITRFAGDVCRILDHVDDAVATGKTRQRRQVEKFDADVCKLFADACDQFAGRLSVEIPPRVPLALKSPSTPTPPTTSKSHNIVRQN